MTGVQIAQEYHNIYLGATTLFTLILYSQYSKKNGALGDKTNDNRRESIMSWAFLALAISLFLGFRPLNGGFGDSWNYEVQYNMNEGNVFSFNWDTSNLIWDNIFNFWSSSSLGIVSWFVLIDLLDFLLMFWACVRIFKQNFAPAFIVYLGAYSTFSYSVNGLKAGLASSIFILALSYYPKYKYCIPIMLISWGIHHSMHVPIVGFLATLLIKNSKFYYSLWIICLILAALHITAFQELFSQLTDEGSSEYLTSMDEEWGGKTGFRLDFVIYSAVPILVGYYTIFKKKTTISATYKTMLHTYININSIWMLCMYAQFTNRIAYLSWFLYPVVLIFPFLNESIGHKRYAMFSKIMLIHLAFTIFMTIK